MKNFCRDQKDFSEKDTCSSEDNIKDISPFIKSNDVKKSKFGSKRRLYASILDRKFFRGEDIDQVGG